MKVGSKNRLYITTHNLIRYKTSLINLTEIARKVIALENTFDHILQSKLNHSVIKENVTFIPDINMIGLLAYLGYLFADKGTLNNDIKINIQNKQSNITVKYSNFCARNFCAPINIKLKVLHACVISSLCYGSETWGKHTSSQLESTYKMGIKTTLSVRFNTCDDIIYIESGSYSTACSIKKRQILVDT